MLYTIAYTLIVVALTTYCVSWLAALIAAQIVFFSAKSWEVNPKDPIENKRGVIRVVEPFEMLVVGRAGKPAFPVIAESAERLTVKGLQDEDDGMKRDTREDWDVVRVDNNKEYRPTTQSKWGFLSPIYLFRKLVFLQTERHVVRIWFPFFIWGFYKMYEPIIMTFVRARSGEKKRRSSMMVLDPLEGSTMMVVEDKTDHVLFQYPLRVVTDAIPTRDGFSIRADVTIVLEVANLHRQVAWKDSSSQIRSVVSSASSSVFRPGTLDEVYAVSKGNEQTLQNTIADYLTNKEKLPFQNTSVLEALGEKCIHVTLNDLIPADAESKRKIESIMAIPLEGRNRAKASAALLEVQTKILDGVEPDVIQGIATITAAEKSDKVDMLIGVSGTQDPAALATANRIVKNTKSGSNSKTKTKGGGK